MKILLVGEYSGVHKNLKDGLSELGHKVICASSGDGFKKIENDINWNPKHSGFLGKIERDIKVFSSLSKLKDFDIIQFISPKICTRKFGVNALVFSRLINQNKKSFLIGAGCNDPFTASFLKYKFRKRQLFREISRAGHGKLWCQTPGGKAFTLKLFNNINGYIPLMYEYAQGLRDAGYEKLLPTIPMPINLKNIEFRENEPKDKIVFFHGLTRENVKGTPLIREALNNLKSKYPNDVSVMISGNMPLNDYLELIKNVNVVIDQAYSASYGMNVVYSLTTGKVVVGGGERECLQEFQLKESPIIPIEPSVQDIELKLTNLLETRNRIPEIGWQSRQYVEKVHNYTIIARRFLSVWRNS